MKKTTIRIAGFLLAAACVALLASCNQANGKKETITTTTTTTVQAPFNKAKLPGTWKVMNWKNMDMTSGNQAYLFNFDNNGVLRIAYCADTTQSTLTVNTRDTKVNCDISGVDAIKSTDLKIDEKSQIVLAGNDTLVIKAFNKTANKTETMLLMKEKDDSKLAKANFTTSSNPNAVVNAFNQAFFGIAPVSFTHPGEKTFKIEKLNGKTVGNKSGGSDPKVYNVAFIKNKPNKLILTVDQTAGKTRSEEKDYEVVATPVLGVAAPMTITVKNADALGLNKAAFTVQTETVNMTITIGKGNTTTVLKTEGATAYNDLVGASYTENDSTVMTAIGNFGKNEA